MIDMEQSFVADIVADDPACTYKSLEARVAPSIDPSVDVDVACFMTTDTVDADNEVVLPSGADLSRFEKNPVLMLCHAHGQPGSYYPLPIGKVIWTNPDISSVDEIRNGAMALLIVGFGLTHSPSPSTTRPSRDRL